MVVRPSDEEDKHFIKENADRRAKLRLELERKANDVRARGSIKETLGARNDEVVSRIRELGFDGDTARVFDLLPLIHVAWADGSVSLRERARVLDVLKTREIDPESDAYLIVEALLEVQPSETFLVETLSLLQELDAGSGDQARTLVELCIDVANASGGLLGLGLIGNKISAEEREVIERIARALGVDAERAFLTRLKDKS